VVRPEADVDGLAFRPDLIKVSYFDDEASMDRARAEPSHARLESKRAAVVAESLRLVARARVLPPEPSRVPDR
jgi:hypothetical protein